LGGIIFFVIFDKEKETVMTTRLSARAPEGPLVGLVEGFRCRLLAEGYAEGTAAAHVLGLRHLDVWLSGRDGWQGVVTGADLDEFYLCRKALGRVWPKARSGLGLVERYLGSVGLFEPGAPGPMAPLDGLMADFEEHLRRGRGVGPVTAANYVRWVRPFAAGLADGSGAFDWSLADVERVHSWMRGRAQGRRPGSVRLIVCSTRAFLRWAHLRGWVGADVAGAVMSARAGRPEPGRMVTAEEVDRLVGGVCADGEQGKRDVAVLLLLARLGMRAGEVAGLGLDDIDWERGTVTARGKGRSLTLPLPVDVGAALASYLQCRSHGDGRAVFTAVRAPFKALTAGRVTMIVADRAEAAGLGRFHAHRLRHAAACRVIEAGGGLEDVARLLGHACVSTSAIYSAVALERLAALVRPWPGAAL
jgi:site-specific recombinase XerD